MNPVVHFEMPYENSERMAKFYTDAFGWKTTITGPEFGNYVLAGTTETDEATQRPTAPGAINGGFFEKSSDNAHPSIVIGVEDIRTAMQKVTEAGGKVLGEPVEIPGIGMYVSFIDTEGNRASLMQSVAAK